MTFGLAIVQGQVVVVQPSLSGPLAMMLSFEDMVHALETQFNQQLRSQGRIIHDIRIEQGIMVVVVE
jgi:hypothetical protein